MKFRAMSKLFVGIIALVLLTSLNANSMTKSKKDETDWLNLEQLEVRGKIKLKWNRVHYKKAKVWIKNVSEQSIVGPMRIVITKGGKRVLNADGYTAQGNPFFLLSDDPSYTLVPGKRSKKVKVLLRNGHHRNTFRFKAVAQYQPPFMLQLLHAADMDGATGALENVKNFSAVLEKLRSEYPHATLTLSSGDNYIPGPRYTAAADESLIPLLGIPGEGRGDIAFLNAMKFQASAVGNHDLDGGTAAFASIINSEVDDETASSYPGALFPYLSTNLDFTADAELVELVRDSGLPAKKIPNSLTRSVTVEVNGETVGIVGATTPRLASITSTGDIIILPEDAEDILGLVTEIQAAVDELMAVGVDKIILLSHMQQIGVEIELATLLYGVDVIVAGGSNTLLADENDMLRDGDSAATECISPEISSLYSTSCTYPIVLRSASDEPVLVVNTDGDYKYLGRLILGFDGNGVIVEESLDSEVNGVYATSDEGLAAVGNPVPNKTVVKLVEGLSAVLIERDGNILGATTTYLDGRRSQVRTEETNMGNLTSEANLWLAKLAEPDAEISIKNGGGIRDDIGYFAYPPGSVSEDDLEFYPPAANPTALKEEGEISQFDIQGTLRFNNGLVLLTATAEELISIIEHAVAATAPGETPGRFPQVAGLRFSFDPERPAGARVINLVVNRADGTEDTVYQNGLMNGDPDRTFRLVTLNFLAGGGDGYPFPARDRVDLVGSGLIPDNAGMIPSTEGGDANFADAGSEQDALAEYLQEFFDPVLNAAATPYSNEETSIMDDERIQNLSERGDTILSP